MDHAEKRLAVHVEDHPVEYAGFAGVIPAGNYGAGTVEIWDHGTWEPDGDPTDAMAKGELKFALSGDRLHGRFVLVRLKPRPKERGENWLLIKEKEETQAKEEAQEKGETRPARTAPSRRRRITSGAGSRAPAPGAARAALPAAQAPMLATNAPAAPDDHGWVSEVKFDGYRLLAFKDDATVRLVSRNAQDWTSRLPTLAAKIAALPARTLLVDGELVFFRPDGLSGFAELQAALSESREASLDLVLFDLLHRDGWDLRPCTLLDRKACLHALLAAAGAPPALRYSEHLTHPLAEVHAQGCGLGLEGIVCKRADSAYRAGRSSAWLKLKCRLREAFIVLGWTAPQRRRTGLGALHLGYFDAAGGLHYAGGVGTGFSEQVLGDLAARLAPLAADPPAGLLLTAEPPPRGLHWVRPDLVAEIEATGWSGAGRLRHAVFLGLREDKTAADIVRAVPDPGAARRTLAGAPSPAMRPSPPAHRVNSVRLTHPDRELWPGITKAALAAYWTDIAAAALPGIADRPLALVRCPDGINGQQFFQKHAGRGLSPGLAAGECHGAPYLSLHDADGLLACTQINAVELHGWGSRLDDPGRPDRLVFDLDPGEGVTWPRVIDAARHLREALEAEGLASFCRTSGGHGLHLVAPLMPAADWDTARAWCRGFAERCEAQFPDRYVASVPKARRRGRILIDWLRNGLGSTAICSLSPRARPGATVATPLAWREVTQTLDPGSFTLATVPARLARQRRDPWEAFARIRQTLPAPPEAAVKQGRAARSPGTARRRDGV